MRPSPNCQIAIISRSFSGDRRSSISARLILPRATMLLELSNTIGRCFPAGTDILKGLAPSIGVMPPQGAIVAGALEQA